MPPVKSSFGRGGGRLGVALMLVDVWRRIPPAQRRLLIAQARRHGPRLAKQAYEARRRGPRAR